MGHPNEWLRRRLGAARSIQMSHVRVVEGDEIIPRRVARLLCFFVFFFAVERKPVREVAFKNLSIHEKCICCGSILSLVQILFSFVSNSLSFITIPKNKGK